MTVSRTDSNKMRSSLMPGPRTGKGPQVIKTRYQLRTLRAPIEGEARTLCNKEYVVIPVVALIEGVRHAGGSPAPELVLAEAFGRHVETWNGRPIVVNHPVNASGQAVLASSPYILETSYLGTLMGAKVEDKKLIVEAWLDVAAIEASGSDGVLGMWKRLVGGETVEVSVGAIVYTKRGDGEWDGKKYSGSWDIVIPDHLAFLDGEQIGACSVEDGCGTFRTHSVGQVTLSKGARDKMAKAAVGTLKTVGSGGTTAASTETSGSPREACACGDKKGLVAGQPEEVQVAVGQGWARMLWNADTFDHDRRQLMQRALTDKFGSSKGSYVVTFNDTRVVFEQFNGDKFALYEMEYECDTENNVTLTGDAVEVVLQSKTVPIGGKKEKNMSKALQSLAAKSKKKDEEEDPNEKEPDDDADDTSSGKGKKKGMSSIPTHILELAKALDSSETATDIVKALAGTGPGKEMAEALKVREAVRAQSVKIIQASSGGKHFTAEMLAEMPFSALQQTAIAFLAADKRAAAKAEARALEEEGSEEEFEEGAEGEEFEEGEEEGEEEDGSVTGLSAIMDLDAAANRANAPPPAKKQAPKGKGTVARLAAPGRASFAGRAASGQRGNGAVPQAPDVFAFNNDGEYVGPKAAKATA